MDPGKHFSPAPQKAHGPPGAKPERVSPLPCSPADRRALLVRTSSPADRPDPPVSLLLPWSKKLAGRPHRYFLFNLSKCPPISSSSQTYKKPALSSSTSLSSSCYRSRQAGAISHRSLKLLLPSPLVIDGISESLALSLTPCFISCPGTSPDVSRTSYFIAN
jgi:hypothetical protein